ncbi:GNAT family N-acetyltransferase [Bifidobacterium mongoliense]|jgi:phosphinothricin acetyltransferase|uniref:Phosphinothricin N-acetyltransferase n=2 Tax=Bifidobacterium mongoliense TaxID=518643 RepID=A0A087C0Z7_9BIFI|nr:GNAT family N-acetyltransferase [Bifidobacterium mongoliense]KFI76947.1 phosphinothricin N-acetyltransferase [Bifidobacterium mongoliense DSM 21395]ROT87246.1 GNAT family acetyltransferase [Bifidobacterium mongoliense]
MTQVSIRPAREEDLPAITAIYNQAVIAGGATADLTPRTLDQRRAWVESHAPRTRYPVVVMEDGAGEVVAFGSLSRYHEREGYDGVDELSYYVDERHRQAGYGSRMVDWLLSAARERGVRMAVTLIFAENAGSTALMHRFGFHRFGLLPRACSDGSRLLDMAYWYLDL